MIIKVIDCDHDMESYINLDYVTEMMPNDHSIWIKIVGEGRGKYFYANCDGKDILKEWLNYKKPFIEPYPHMDR